MQDNGYNSAPADAMGLPRSRRPVPPMTFGGYVALTLLALFVLGGSFGPLFYERAKHGLSGSPDRASLLFGTWVGQVSDSSAGPHGPNRYTVLLELQRQWITSIDSAHGKLQVCSSTGLLSSAEIRKSWLTDGKADLTVWQHPPTAFPIRVDSAAVEPADGKLRFSADIADHQVTGNLERADPAAFDNLCGTKG